MEIKKYLEGFKKILKRLFYFCAAVICLMMVLFSICLIIDKHQRQKSPKEVKEIIGETVQKQLSDPFLKE